MGPVDDKLVYPVDWERLKKDEALRKKLTYVINIARSERRWHEGTLNLVQDLMDHLEGLIKDHS